MPGMLELVYDAVCMSCMYFSACIFHRYWSADILGKIRLLFDFSPVNRRSGIPKKSFQNKNLSGKRRGEG
jgi:hypothetical protein